MPRSNTGMHMCTEVYTCHSPHIPVMYMYIYVLIYILCVCERCEVKE